MRIVIVSVLVFFYPSLFAQNTFTPPTCSIGITGDSLDVTVPTKAGIVLMGGSKDVEAALQWMISRSEGGDFVILRASGSTGYNDFIYGLGKVNSVETLLIDSRSKAESEFVGKRIREAEALFIAGGDQANYVNFWSNTPVSEAIDYLIHTKRIPIGGTSAGCAVLSGFVFDARQGTAVSSEVLTNPYHTSVSLSKSFIQAPILQNVIADQHYSQRSREGRHVAFLARLVKDFNIKRPRGIGVDEKTAVCIDEDGNATVFGSGSAYFLQALSSSELCEAGKPLVWKNKQNAVGLVKVDASSTGTLAFNLKHWPKKFSSYWWIENGVLMRR